jgi:formate dehydrogenase subunit beta
MKGIPLQAGETPSEVLRDLMRRALERGAADQVLVPSKGPEGSFPWILASDPGHLDLAEPVPPVMSVQGARALASVIGPPESGMILAVMRPCEARAAVELSKLRQFTLDGVLIVTYDCPGALPMALWTSGEVSAPDPGGIDSIRPLCAQCTEFTAHGDLCVVSSGSDHFALPLTDRGREFAADLGLEGEASLDEWAAWKADLSEEREKRGESERSRLREEVGGLSSLTGFFSGCVGCRSCRTVCPVCYCRLCFIDMKDRRSPSSAHIRRSVSAGGVRLVSDTLLFHIGRMAHMNLSCVSCGMCEDACPAGIPVGQLVNMVSRETSSLFDYSAGEDPSEPLPLNTYLTEELHEFED